MEFKGISKTFSTVGDKQYETIGAFWDELSGIYGRERLRGLGYGWTDTSIEYVIGLINCEIEGWNANVKLPDVGWEYVSGRTEKLGEIYSNIYKDGPLTYEIEMFDDTGNCRIAFYREANMGGVMNNIFVNTRSSIKLTGTKTIYFDPLEIDGAPHDADLIFITHEHYDHFSPDDIRKVVKEDTQIIVPVGMLAMVRESQFPVQTFHGLLPGQTQEYEGVKCQGIPAYNIDKPFHPQSNDWLGYLVELDGKTYYAMGDTDVIPEAVSVDADVVFVPIGGKYTMDASEAAEFINGKKRGLVVPIHYGDSGVGDTFVRLLRPEIEVQRFW